MSEKKRGTKTSRVQFELYLDELETNKFFKDQKFDARNPNVLNETWESLKTKLNSSGGSVHDVAGWKRVFSDWKCQVRARARKIKINATQTGNNSEFVKPLNDLEERLINITGKVVIAGIYEIPEIGFDDTTETTSESAIATSSETASATTVNVAMKPNTTFSVRKRKSSLFTCLESLSKQENESSKMYKELKKIRKTTDKLLKLKRLELDMKYPDYTFIVTSDDR